MGDLSERLTNRVQISSDGPSSRVEAVERAVGADVDCGQVAKFCDVRMSMRRFTGRTNGFSKKLENVTAAVAVHFAHYNFVRQRQPLRVTPACTRRDFRIGSGRLRNWWSRLRIKGKREAVMYFLSVLLLMLLLPVASILLEHSCLHSAVPLMLLAGKWFVFWSVGVRLSLAGLRQSFQPRFTSEHIFGLKSDDALPIVRELGTANFATGIVGVASLAKPGFVLPVAIAATIFYGIAGTRHLAESTRMRNETIAMVSDLFAFLVLGAYVAFVELA
jgi:hypothetical protein